MPVLYGDIKWYWDISAKFSFFVWPATYWGIWLKTILHRLDSCGPKCCVCLKLSYENKGISIGHWTHSAHFKGCNRGSQGGESNGFIKRQNPLYWWVLRCFMSFQAPRYNMFQHCHSGDFYIEFLRCGKCESSLCANPKLLGSWIKIKLTMLDERWIFPQNVQLKFLALYCGWDCPGSLVSWIHKSTSFLAIKLVPWRVKGYGSKKTEKDSVLLWQEILRWRHIRVYNTLSLPKTPAPFWLIHT